LHGGKPELQRGHAKRSGPGTVRYIFDTDKAWRVARDDATQERQAAPRRLERTEHAKDGGADGKDVRIGGGAGTIRQFLRARLIDELHVAIAPRVLGDGEHLFRGLDLRALDYECSGFTASEKAISFSRACRNDARRYFVRLAAG
jgi:dihydrofolate reductase